MGFLENIFGSNEESEYKTTLARVSNPLMDKIDVIKEKEVREFFKTIIDAAERALRGILFKSPEEFNFEKQVTEEDIDFWLRKVSLVLMSYSYYFYRDAMETQEHKALSGLVEASYQLYWQRMYNSYNQIFNGNISQKEVDYYAAGLKEDVERGYSRFGNMEKVNELTTQDYKTIGSELLKAIWKEDVKSNERKGIFLGVRIWQAHQQIVQPFLAKLLNM